MAISVARLTISRDRAITFHCNFHMAQSSPEKLRDVCRAAGTGDIETVNAWLRTAPDVNAQDDKGRPLLLLLVCGTINAIVADVRAAGGTYSAYLHQHRKQVLMLRCLATKKGRAKTTDPVMNFLVKLGDNGVIWKILSFWPPPP